MDDEIKAVYSRHNKDLFLSFYDMEDNLIVKSKMPKLKSYKVGEEVNGIGNKKYVVVKVEDNVFNPKKLHIAKLVKKDTH